MAFMSSSLPNLPNNVADCHVMIRDLQEKLQAACNGEEVTLVSKGADDETQRLRQHVAQLQETITEQAQTIERLQEDNKLLLRALFGSRRERFTADDPEQLLLFAAATLEPAASDDSEEEQDKPQPPKKRRGKGRQKRVFSEFLPREQERLGLKDDEIPEEMRDNPKARRFFKKIGERLELIPMQIKIVEQYQEVIALDQEDGTTSFATAWRPPSLFTTFASPSLLAYLTASRFADHLPYYRTEDILGRVGLHLDRSTQTRWMSQIAKAVTPLIDLMWREALLSGVLAVDETPVKELAPGGCLTGYLWTGVGDPGHPYDCFFYTSDRRSVGPETFLEGYRGYLLSDAYVAYERIGRLWPGVFKCSCWVHARRKFEACHILGATDATTTAMAYFRRLFDIEELCREMSDEDRLDVRQKHSRPLVESLYDWMVQQSVGLLPKSKLLGAINYMLKRWDSFTRFLESGAIPMDSNLAERSLKYPILGRKAWLFVGNPEAGETAAKLFTLTKSCNRHRIDPFAYLQDVYTRLPMMSEAELPSLLPDNWIADHPQHLMDKRVQEAIDRARRTREQRAWRRSLRAG